MIEKGADPYAKNNEELDPVDFCLSSRNQHFISFFRKVATKKEDFMFLRK